METHVPKEFKPFVFYNQDGDQFDAYWKMDNSYSVNIRDGETTIFALHKSMETDEVIGLTLYGVKYHLKRDNMLTNEPKRVEMNEKFAAWVAKQEEQNVGTQS